jgi:hypothetical protein
MHDSNRQRSNEPQRIPDGQREISGSNRIGVAPGRGRKLVGRDFDRRQIAGKIAAGNVSFKVAPVPQLDPRPSASDDVCVGHD